MTGARRLPAAELKKFLGAFSPEIAKIALRVRAFVLGQAPLAHELIYDADDAVALGYSFTERPCDAFCHVAIYAGWVNLGFNRGSLIPDPERLLEGSGRWVRHIRIESLDDLREPHVGRFLRAAMKTAPRGSVPGSIEPLAERPRHMIRRKKTKEGI